MVEQACLEKLQTHPGIDGLPISAHLYVFSNFRFLNFNHYKNSAFVFHMAGAEHYERADKLAAYCRPNIFANKWGW